MKRIVVRRFRAARPRTVVAKGTQNGIKLVNNEVLNNFNPSILDLGNISSPAREIEAVTAVFDLSGFTKFCNRVDAQLAIPKFLNDFLDWLFSSIKAGLTKENLGERKAMWAEPPIMVKFMGDGVMLIWNTRGMSEILICKLVAILYDIYQAYGDDFYPRISAVVDRPPAILRCGLARGKVFSVGNGKDYVGHCINNASRLTQLGVLTFCFPSTGFQIKEYLPEEYHRIFTKKMLSIRGVGENELVWVVKDEFDRLPAQSKALMRDPGTFAPEPRNLSPNPGLRLYSLR
jgi:hypothetical protein